MKPARHYLKLRPRFWTRVSAGIAGFILLQGFVVQPSSAEQAIRSGLQHVELAEKAGLSAEAERFYELALEADPTLEAAHFGLAQIWIGRKELVKSLQVLDKGLESNAGSVRLLLLKVDLLSQLDRELEARHALEEAFRRCPNDPKVLARIAFMRDVHGDRAGETYEALAGVVARDGPNPSAVKAALERGIVVSLRDGERARGARFGQRLRELGSRDIPDLSISEPLASHRKDIVVPGGMKAVALAALMQEDVSVERFVGEYASTIARHTRGRDRTSREAYLNGVRNYFQTLSSLKAAGRSDGDCTEIVLSSSEKSAIENTERVLKLFGWRMKRSGRKIVLEVGTNESDAVNQPYLSALGVDEVQMKSALENGTPFVLRIVDQRVPVIFDEEVWLERVLEIPGFRSGLLEAMLENPAVARLYSSLTAMNDEAQLLVLRVAEPKQLLERYSDLLAAYGAALSVVHGRILLPGGDDAAPVWQQFVGPNPKDSHAFI